jgi:hypothetical protein
MTIVGRVTKTMLTTGQVARLLGKSPRQVRRDAAAGKLPGAAKLEGHTGAYIFDAEVFEAYLAGRRVLGGYPETAAAAS